MLLYRYTNTYLYFYTANIEEGNKKVADGWKDEGILCYVWPYIPVAQEA